MKDFKIDKKLQDHLNETGHKLKSRRDFLSHGLIAFGAMVSFPSLLGMGYRRALSECGGGQGPTMTPFMAFDMAGGASMPANFLAGGRGGPEDLIQSYNLLGWDPRQTGALNTEMGLPMSARYSKMLEGILATTTPEARRNFRMGSICHFAQDDTSGNKLNAACLILRAGYRGTFITNGMGLQNSLSGGNSAPCVDNNALKPTFINSVDAALGATSFGGPSFQGVPVPKLRAMAEGQVDLSRLQKQLYLENPGGDTMADLSKCAYERSLDFLNGVSGIDPRTDAIAQQVYGINQNTPASDMNAILATLSMNTIKGQAGPSVYTLGGCDYHDGTATTGDAKDRAMGVEIGRAVQLAHRYQKPFFFQLLTDGGCGATSGTRNWSSDSGDKCMTILGYYNPAGAPRMIRQQVGHYTNGQGAERTTLIGSEPLLVGYAVLANYLNINGKLNQFHEYAPGVFTGAGQLDSVLLFEGGQT